MTKEEALKIIRAIESNYPYFVTKSETVQFWLDVCSEMDFDYVWAGLLKHIRRSPYPPLISEIMALSEEGQGDLDMLSHNIGGCWMSEYSIRESKYF